MADFAITGGLGFIGSALARSLLADGAEILIIDDFSAPHAPANAAALTGRAGVRVVRADAADRGSEALAARCGAIFHLAALPGVRAAHPRRVLRRCNVAATERMLRAAQRSGARLVLASTSSVYGNAALPAREDSPRAPLGPYAASKVLAEDSCLAAAAGGTDAVITRLFTVYGPGQRADMAFASWIDAITASRPIRWHPHPGAARDFTFIGDAVAGLRLAMDHGRPGRAYNVGAGAPASVADALALIEELAGAAALRIEEPPHRGEAVLTFADLSRSRRELGYEPQVRLREGLAAQAAAAGALRAAA